MPTYPIAEDEIDDRGEFLYELTGALTGVPASFDVGCVNGAVMTAGGWLEDRTDDTCVSCVVVACWPCVN